MAKKTEVRADDQSSYGIALKVLKDTAKDGSLSRTDAEKAIQSVSGLRFSRGTTIDDVLETLSGWNYITLKDDVIVVKETKKKATKRKNKRIIASLSGRENNTMAAVLVALEFIKGNVKRCGPDLTSDIVKGRLERALKWYDIEPREATVRMAAKAALNYINNTANSGREISAEEDLEKYLKKALKVYGITKSDIEWYKIPTTAEQPIAPDM